MSFYRSYDVINADGTMGRVRQSIVIGTVTEALLDHAADLFARDSRGAAPSSRGSGEAFGWTQIEEIVGRPN